jgi:hypothetical protein
MMALALRWFVARHDGGRGPRRAGPPTQLVLRVEPIDLPAWIRIIAVATTILIAVEIEKAVRRRPRPTLGALP